MRKKSFFVGFKQSQIEKNVLLVYNKSEKYWYNIYRIRSKY